jgi:hypothetical protein
MAFFKYAIALLAVLALAMPALAAKPKPPNRGIKARLAALGVPSYAQQFGPTEKRGTNLYAEVPMTTLPSPPGTKPPKRMRNLWSVVAVTGKDGSPAVRGAIASAKALAAVPERAQGTIFVFVDPESPDATKAFAELVWMTGRTVTSVDCGGMADQAVACREAFAEWNLPTRR